MENTSTEVLSSTANHSVSGAGDGGNASEESGWTSYIDYFMETQRRQEEEASSAASSTDDVGGRSTSQYSGGDGAVAGSSRLPALVEPSEASRRLSLKKKGRRTMKVMYDESLEDTATSPISSPKLIELRESDANHQKKEDTRDEFSHYYKKTTAAEELLAGYHNLSNNGGNRTIDMIGHASEYDSYHNLSNNGGNRTIDMICHASEYDSNELNKKGLLLSSCALFPSIAHPS